MKTIELSSVLTPEQIQAVTEIKARYADIERTNKLKAYLGKFRTELEAKGVLPEYLAYYLAYALPDFSMNSRNRMEPETINKLYLELLRLTTVETLYREALRKYINDSVADGNGTEMRKIADEALRRANLR